MNKKYENSKAEKYLSVFPKTIQFITLFMILYNFYHKIVNHCQRLNLKEIIFVKIMISLQFLAQSLLEISYSNLPHLRIASWDSSSEEKSKLDPGVREKAPFQGVKMAKKGCHSLFRPVHMYKKYILKKIGSKRPFQLSAVVGTIYRRLYGVATANQMINTEIQI